MLKMAKSIFFYVGLYFSVVFADILGSFTCSSEKRLCFDAINTAYGCIPKDNICCGNGASCPPSAPICGPRNSFGEYCYTTPPATCATGKKYCNNYQNNQPFCIDETSSCTGVGASCPTPAADSVYSFGGCCFTGFPIFFNGYCNTAGIQSCPSMYECPPNYFCWDNFRGKYCCPYAENYILGQAGCQSLPTSLPTASPTVKPTAPTNSPTYSPSFVPSSVPTAFPSLVPTSSPTSLPSQNPSALPSFEPTKVPSVKPTLEPSLEPTLNPTEVPSLEPTLNPTENPSKEPTLNPTEVPSLEPTLNPTENPSKEPSESPSREPSFLPTKSPSQFPTEVPSNIPTFEPSESPSSEPTSLPSSKPSLQPIEALASQKLSKSSLTLIVVFCIIAFILCLFCVYFLVVKTKKRLKERDDEKLKDLDDWITYDKGGLPIFFPAVNPILDNNKNNNGDNNNLNL